MKEPDDPKTNVKGYSDEHIDVRNLGFDPETGEQKLAIDEKHAGVGRYQITVTFASGNRANIPFDGANVNRDKEPILRTYKPEDEVVNIEVVPEKH